jgi:hypothetical protein
MHELPRRNDGGLEVEWEHDYYCPDPPTHAAKARWSATREIPLELSRAPCASSEPPQGRIAHWPSDPVCLDAVGVQSLGRLFTDLADELLGIR